MKWSEKSYCSECCGCQPLDRSQDGGSRRALERIGRGVAVKGRRCYRDGINVPLARREKTTILGIRATKTVVSSSSRLEGSGVATRDGLSIVKGPKPLVAKLWMWTNSTGELDINPRNVLL